MSEQVDLQAVMERIKKLLRLSTSSNPHEASLAAEKAQELMFAYGLSLAQVEAVQEDDRRFTVEGIRLGTMGSISWKRALVASIADACCCEALWRPGTAIGEVVGRRHNAMLVEHLYVYLQREIERMAEADWKQIRSPRFSATSFKLNFCHGAVATVGYRLRMKRRSLEDANTTGKALVVADQAEVAAYRDKLFPNSRPERTPARDGRPGFGNGVLAGQQIRLDDPLESGDRREQMALPGAEARG